MAPSQDNYLQLGRLGYKKTNAWNKKHLTVSWLKSMSCITVKTNQLRKHLPRFGSNTPLFQLFFIFLRSLNASTLCNWNCSCGNDFSPVCGEDNIVYFSACHAGCRNIASEEDGHQVSSFDLDFNITGHHCLIQYIS